MTAYGATGALLSGATASSAPVPKPAGLAVGQFAAVNLYLESSTTPTPPTAGWEQLGGAPAATSVQWHHVFWKILTQADIDATNWNFTFSSTYRKAFAVTVTDPDPTSPVEDFDSAGNSSSVNATPAVAVDTLGSSRTLLWFASGFLTGAWTPPAGFTERLDESSEVTAASLEQAVAGSSGSLSGSHGASTPHTAWLLAIRGPDVTSHSGAFFPFFA